MKEINKSFENIWKILALLCLGILIGLFSARFISAGSWPLPREATCNLFNLTGTDCEKYWCEHVNECNYSIEKTLCICYNNVTVVYVNQTLNGTNYNNCTNCTITYNQTDFNFTNNETIAYCVNYTNYMIRELRNSFTNTSQQMINSVSNQNKSGTVYYGSVTDEFPAWGYVVIICIIILAVAFTVYSSTKFKQEFPRSKSMNRDFTKASEFQGEKKE